MKRQSLEIIKRGLVMSRMMPINEGPNISPVVLLLAVPPMWSNYSDPVDLRVRGAGESSDSLSIELTLMSRNSKLPMLGIFYFDDKDRPEDAWSRRHLHDLDNKVRNVTFRIVRKVTLRSDYVALGGGEKCCENRISRPIPYVFSHRRVCGIVL
jgi:hypothetical protein